MEKVIRNCEKKIILKLNMNILSRASKDIVASWPCDLNETKKKRIIFCQSLIEADGIHSTNGKTNERLIMHFVLEINQI